MKSRTKNEKYIFFKIPWTFFNFNELFVDFDEPFLDFDELFSNSMIFFQITSNFFKIENIFCHEQEYLCSKLVCLFLPRKTAHTISKIAANKKKWSSDWTTTNLRAAVARKRCPGQAHASDAGAGFANGRWRRQGGGLLC